MDSPALKRSAAERHIVIGDVPVSIAGRRELKEAWRSDCIQRRIGTGDLIRPRLVFDTNGHAISLAASDARYRHALQAADIVHADGGFIVTLSRIIGSERIRGRSSTTDLIHDFAGEAELNGFTFYLLGGDEGTNAECVEILKSRYPLLTICGRHHGFFSEEDEQRVVDEINQLQPDVVWVGLGKPKEQLFCMKHKDKLRVGWLVTCGGCFNYITGSYKRAPKWMQIANLEWLHRMLTKPQQLFWRYFTTTPHALWLAITKSNGRVRDRRASNIGQ